MITNKSIIFSTIKRQILITRLYLLPKMDKNSITSLDELTRIVFFMVYMQGSKDNKRAQELLNLMIQYSRDDDGCLLQLSGDRLKVAHLLINSSLDPKSTTLSLKIKFMCDYGCAIKFTKEKEDSPVNIQIISLEKWATGANDAAAKKLQPINPQGQSSFFTPTITKYNEDLLETYKTFEIKLKDAFQAIDKRQLKKNENYQRQYTPKEVEEAYKLALQTSSYFSAYDTEERRLKINDQSRKKVDSVVTIGQDITLKDSEPATAWFMVRAVVLNLLGMSKEQKLMGEKFIIGFKGYLLKKTIQDKLQKNSYRRIEVEKYKLCLDQIISEYKHKISTYGVRKQRFNSLISAIINTLQKLKGEGGRFTSQIDHRLNFYKGINLEIKSKPHMICAEKIFCQIKLEGDKQIKQFPIKIELRYAFQELLDLYKIIINKKSKSEVNKWLLLTQKTVWQISEKLTIQKQIIDLDIHMRQIECDRDASTMGEVVLIYQSIINESQYSRTYYGNQLEGQTYSHIQLMRAITAIIAFQSVKLNRARKGSNLSKYKIPFDIDDLYNKVHSNNGQARRAIENLKKYYSYYKKDKNKKSIFQLNSTSTNFHEFARAAGQQSRSAQAWKESMDKLFVALLNEQTYKLSSQRLQGKINAMVSYASTVPNQINYHNLVNQMNVQQSFNVQTPYKYYPENDPWLFAFLNNIPPDVLGMIKMLYSAQNPSNINSLNQPSNLMFINKLFNGEKQPINIYAVKDIKPQTLNINDTIKTASPSIGYIYSGNSITSDNYSKIEFYKEIKKFDCENQYPLLVSNLKKFLRLPNDIETIRQHDVYASYSKRPQEIELQFYKAMSNVRSGQHTQLILLCSGILERKIVSNSYNKKARYAERLILQTGGRLASYNKQVEIHFGVIRKLISQFMNVWEYTDTRFCPILAPLLTILGKHIAEDFQIYDQKMQKIYFQLSKKCLDQFERAEKELIGRPQQMIQWSQRYLCMAAIACFRQVVLSQQDNEEIVFLLEMIFRLRLSEILSIKEVRPTNIRDFVDELEYSVEKAIFRNIGVLSDHLAKNAKNMAKLNTILRKIDNSLPHNVNWSKINLFHFRGFTTGIEPTVYQINLSKGQIYKNGKQISCLTPEIKNNSQFIYIFGKDRQFQVFPRANSRYLRTKDNVNHNFEIDQKKGKIYFQFLEDGREIRHIIKKQGQNMKEQKWTLIPRSKLQLISCHIPKIYLDYYLAWFSEERKCIVFRKAKFQQIYEIGIVIFLEDTSPHPVVKSASHIIYHNDYKNQDLDDICKENNQKYDEIILRNNQPLVTIQTYKALSRFQSPQYIFQLKSRKTKDTYYLLHRYLLKFKVVQGKRLLSETYFGYALDYSFYDQPNCLFNKFNCLVLEKYLDNPTILNNHKRVVLISDKVAVNGDIQKQVDSLLHIQTFKYDIHDFFGDIRGLNRQSIFHLAGLMLSINDNIKVSFIQMTPLQYAMYLMRSCFTNRPFSKAQWQKLENIIQMGTSQVLLLSEALWKMASQLQSILPFSSQTDETMALSNTSKNKFQCWKYEKKFLQCRTLFMKNYNDNLIRYHQRIENSTLKFLGVSKYQNKKESHFQETQFKLDNIIWNGFEVFSGNSFINNFKQISKGFKNFKQKAKKLSLPWSSKNLLISKSSGKQILEQISAHIKYQSPIMREMMKDLAQSMQAYCQEKGNLQFVEKQLTPQQKTNQLDLLNALKQQALLIIEDIEKMMTQIKRHNQSHPDVISGIRPTISPAMYTSILCENDLIFKYFPRLSKKAANSLKTTIKIWLQLKTRTASFDRIEQLLRQQKIDVVAVMREILSPRNEVFKRSEWLCFQAEMKIQLWPSQLETFHHLINNKEQGPFCQLNMGEGKTQVIIPLIILHIIYSNASNHNNRPCLPRINLLSSLFEQARGNFFRFISVTGFQIPAIQIPFTRKVKLVKNNISTIQNLVDSFQNKAYILMTRQSRLSEILRFQEGKIICNNLQQNKESYSKYKQIHQKNGQLFQFDFTLKDCQKSLIKNGIFDVYDEIDALMNCKKSYIFSLGDQLQLSKYKIRFEIIYLCIQVFLTTILKDYLKINIAVTDQDDLSALLMVKKGGYPDGLRLLIENATKQQMLAIRRRIARTIVFQSNRNEYSFVKQFKTEINNIQEERLLDYIINPEKESDSLPPSIPKGSKTQIYLLRGILAYGIFQHCLSMRCGVDYGAPHQTDKKFKKKRIAVPYEAADIPSKRSEYQQIEVSILLSFIAYFTKGLNRDYFDQCLSFLIQMKMDSKKTEYKQWIEVLDQDTREKFLLQSKLNQAKMINYNSKAHRDILFDTFKKNRKTIAFWLMNCVFLKDLKQFAKSITASAWDLADVPRSIGFSGTKDNRWLFSNMLTWQPCQTPEIKGTDGKMVHLITKCTNEVSLIQQGSEPLWQRFINLALSKKKIGCIIDAGAICVGKSLKKEIVPWIADRKMFDLNLNRKPEEVFLGISFCDNDGRWLVYDIEGKYYIPRGTTIPDHRTFVIFDQARTRGADLKMNGDVVAALSLGPGITKDSLMQAAGRLRKLGRNQQLVIMATHEVFANFQHFPKDAKQYKSFINNMNKQQNKELLPRRIIAWCCENSIKDNHALLRPFSDLGWKHIFSKVNKFAFQQPLTTDVQIMYSKSPYTRSTVSCLDANNNQLTSHPSGISINKLLRQNSMNDIELAINFDNVCERELEIQLQQAKEQQNSLNAMAAIPEVDISTAVSSIPKNSFIFDSKFKMTSNFINTTQSSSQIGPEIPQLYFVKIKADEIQAVSIRQASRFINANIINKLENSPYEIHMLNSLDLKSIKIKNNKLEGALVSAKFLAGIQNYSIQEENILLNILLKKENSCRDPAQFLRLLRVYLKKYKGSTLQKLQYRIQNESGSM